MIAPVGDRVTPAEFAEALNVPRPTVRRWMHLGHLDFVVIGGRKMLTRDCVRRFLGQ